MESLLTYILQINFLLSIIFLGYHLLLKGMTFYKLNRIYLFMGVLYAFIYPFLDFKSWFQNEVVLHLPMALGDMDVYTVEPVLPELSLIDIILVVFGVGGLLLLLKLAVQLVSLLRIHKNSKKSTWDIYFFQNVIFPIVPFSFFNKIYIHEQQHVDAELYDIFKHEDVHVKGLHTLDILLFEVLLIGCWYNPFVWLMRKAVRQNLEFLTDQQVLDKGIDRQAYQYSLLNVSKQGVALEIGNQFNFKTLKKRIMMMNKRRSTRLELTKYAFLLPVVILVGASFTVNKAEGKIEELVDKVKTIPVDVVLPISNTDHEVSYQDTFKGEIVGVSYKADTLQLTADQKGFPIGRTKGDQLFIHGDVRFGDVLTVLDGIPVKAEEMKDLAPDDIESITVLKDKSATALYGDKGENGVILIVSKSGKVAKTLQGTVGGFRIDSSDSTKSLTGKNGEKPLFVIDGKKLAVNYDLNTVDPNTIHSINVWKGEEASKRYGTEGKDGVIEITSKEAQNKVYNGEIKEVTIIGYASKDASKASKPTEELDVQPEPNGGFAAFRKWIGENYVYPSDAITAKVKGTVQVSFIVEKDGSLSHTRIIRDLGFGTGENAVSLIKKSPQWKPGMKDGKPVRVEYALPIRLDVMNVK